MLFKRRKLNLYCVCPKIKVNYNEKCFQRIKLMHTENIWLWFELWREFYFLVNVYMNIEYETKNLIKCSRFYIFMGWFGLEWPFIFISNSICSICSHDPNIQWWMITRDFPEIYILWVSRNNSGIILYQNYLNRVQFTNPLLIFNLRSFALKYFSWCYNFKICSMTLCLIDYEYNWFPSLHRL